LKLFPAIQLLCTKSGKFLENSLFSSKTPSCIMFICNNRHHSKSKDSAEQPPYHLDMPYPRAFGLGVEQLLLVHKTQPAWCHKLRVLQLVQRVENHLRGGTEVRDDSTLQVGDRQPEIVSTDLGQSEVADSPLRIENLCKTHQKRICWRM